MNERRNKIVQWMLNQGRGIVDAPENVETSTLMLSLCTLWNRGKKQEIVWQMLQKICSCGGNCESKYSKRWMEKSELCVR